MSGEMVAWCCCWWQHGGCEGGAAAAVTVDGGDGDDRDGVAVTCGGVKAAGDDGVEGVVVVVMVGGACYDDDDAMVVVGGGGCGSRRGGDGVGEGAYMLWNGEPGIPSRGRSWDKARGGGAPRLKLGSNRSEDGDQFCVWQKSFVRSVKLFPGRHCGAEVVSGFVNSALGWNFFDIEERGLNCCVQTSLLVNQI
ncbi:hypothetical protein Tco_1214249 [Tanacetum coccineum]